jgi:molecular chaperone DnaK
MVEQPPPQNPSSSRRDSRREDPERFGQVSDDLSLVSSSSERSSPSIPSIPSIQERTSPLPMGMDDPMGQQPGPRPARQVAHTTQMQGAPQAFQAQPARTQASPMHAPPPLPAGARGSTVNLEPSANPARSQPPPPGFGSAPPPAQMPAAPSFGSAPPGPYPSNAPLAGFSNFGSDPPPQQGAGPMAPPPPQSPVFSGYGQPGQAPGPAPGGAPPAIAPFATFNPNSGTLGGSPFGGTTEPPGSGGALQDAANMLGAGGAPVLVDVTPRALIVETAGGYSDTVIPRNSKIPCERMRKFSTGRDGQTAVRIRIGQGESSRFGENTFLGEVELGGLRPASRGDVTVAVSFELDADGTLKVRAWDTITLQEAKAVIQLIGMADESSVVMMINRFAQQPMGPPQ